MSHRGGSVALLHQDVSGTVVDVLEAIGAQQNPAVPARHDHQDVTDVQNLCGKTKRREDRHLISPFFFNFHLRGAEWTEWILQPRVTLPGNGSRHTSTI